MKAIFVLFLSLFLFTCCSSVDPVVNRIQNVKTETASQNRHIKITADKEDYPLQIGATFSVNGDKNFENSIEGHTKINSKGFFEIDTIQFVGPESFTFTETEGINDFFFNGDNFSVEYPDYEFGLELDLAVTKFAAFSFGANFYQFSDKSYIGNSFGLGIFKEHNDWGIRFDVGLDIRHSQSIANFVAHQQNFDNGKRDGIFYQIKKSESYLDRYLSLTINTNRDWLLNLFLSYSLGTKTFYDFTVNRNDIVYDNFGNLSILNQIELGDFEYNQVYNSFAFGMYHNVVDFGRVVFGVRYNTLYDAEKKMNGINTFIQYDFLF